MGPKFCPVPRASNRLAVGPIEFFDLRSNQKHFWIGPQLFPIPMFLASHVIGMQAENYTSSLKQSWILPYGSLSSTLPWMFPSSTHLVPHSYDLWLSFTPLGLKSSPVALTDICRFKTQIRGCSYADFGTHCGGLLLPHSQANGHTGIMNRNRGCGWPKSQFESSTVLWSKATTDIPCKVFVLWIRSHLRRFGR